jgi:hypothetical protein
MRPARVMRSHPGALAGLAAPAMEAQVAAEGSLRWSDTARYALATAAGLDPATLSFEG